MSKKCSLNAMLVAVLTVTIIGSSLLVKWRHSSVLLMTSAAAYSQMSQSRTTDELQKKVLNHLREFYFPSPIIAQAKVGDVATGLVIHEASNSSELDLDTDPCNSVIKVFNKPYTKTSLKETVNCRGKTENKVQETREINHGRQFQWKLHETAHCQSQGGIDLRGSTGVASSHLQGVRHQV